MRLAVIEAIVGVGSLCVSASACLALFAQSVAPDPGPWVDAINGLGFPVAVAASMLILFLATVYIAYRGGTAIVLWGKPYAETLAAKAVATLETVREGSERIAAIQEKLSADANETKRCAKDGLKAVGLLADAVEIAAPDAKRAEVKNHTDAIKRLIEHHD